MFQKWKFMFHDTTMKKKEFFCSHVTKMSYLCLKNNILALTKEQLSHEVSFHWFLIISLFMCVFTTEAHCTSHSTLHNTARTQDEQLLQCGPWLTGICVGVGDKHIGSLRWYQIPISSHDHQKWQTTLSGVARRERSRRQQILGLHHAWTLPARCTLDAL